MGVIAELDDDFAGFGLGQIGEFNFGFISANWAFDDCASERKFNLACSDFASNHSNKKITVFVHLLLGRSILELNGVFLSRKNSPGTIICGH
jgi:hypothetical protein